MTLSNKLNKMIRKYDWADIALVKLSVLVSTLLIVKYIPSLTSLDWYVYILILIVVAVRPISKIFD